MMPCHVDDANDGEVSEREKERERERETVMVFPLFPFIFQAGIKLSKLLCIKDTGRKGNDRKEGESVTVSSKR